MYNYIYICIFIYLLYIYTYYAQLLVWQLQWALHNNLIGFHDPDRTEHVSLAISTWPMASWCQHRLGTQHMFVCQAWNCTMKNLMRAVNIHTSPCTQTWCLDMVFTYPKRLDGGLQAISVSIGSIFSAKFGWSLVTQKESSKHNPEPGHTSWRVPCCQRNTSPLKLWPCSRNGKCPGILGWISVVPMKWQFYEYRSFPFSDTHAVAG